MKYSVAEIDDMRVYVGYLVSYEQQYISVQPEEVERRLRTYMINGTTLDELRNAVTANHAREWLKTHPGTEVPSITRGVMMRLNYMIGAPEVRHSAT